jgi:hypothetical protein
VLGGGRGVALARRRGGRARAEVRQQAAQAALGVGLNPIATSEKQLLSMIGKLV